MAPGVPIERLLERIRERAADYFAEGPVGEVRLFSATQRAYSYVYRVAIDGPTGRRRQIVLKMFQGAPAQFAALTRAWPQFAAHPRFRIPQPLDLLGEGPTLVMEAVSGAPLNDRLPRIWWYGRRQRTAEAGCRAAGQWLRFYHDLDPITPPAAIDMRDKVEGLESSLRELRSAGFDRELCNRLVARALSLAERLDGRRLPMSRVHGEFTIDNVLIDASRVVALDLWAAHTGPVFQDISSFLNSLLLIRLTRPAPWSAIQRFQAAFLDGYASDHPPDRIAIAFLQAIGLADVSLEILARRRSALARRWVEQFMASVLSGLRLAAGGDS
jgi:Phosphotransferase enzyme family